MLLLLPMSQNDSEHLSDTGIRKRPIDVRRFLAVRWHKMTISTPPQPTPSPIARRCAAPGCLKTIPLGQRYDKKFCSRACRSYVWYARHRLPIDKISAADFASLRDAVLRYARRFQGMTPLGYSLTTTVESIGEVAFPARGRKTKRGPDEHGAIHFSDKPYYTIEPFEFPRLPRATACRIVLHFKSETSAPSVELVPITAHFPTAKFAQGDSLYDAKGRPSAKRAATPNAASRARDSAPVRKRQSRLKPDFQLGHALQDWESVPNAPVLSRRLAVPTESPPDMMERVQQAEQTAFQQNVLLEQQSKQIDSLRQLVTMLSQQLETTSRNLAEQNLNLKEFRELLRSQRAPEAIPLLQRVNAVAEESTTQIQRIAKAVGAQREQIMEDSGRFLLRTDDLNTKLQKLTQFVNEVRSIVLSMRTEQATQRAQVDKLQADVSLLFVRTEPAPQPPPQPSSTPVGVSAAPVVEAPIKSAAPSEPPKVPSIPPHAFGTIAGKLLEKHGITAVTESGPSKKPP